MKKSKQLNPEQIQNLFDFTESKHVKHIDVRYELVDHLASGIEAQFVKNPELSFDKALNREFNKFPLSGFYQFVEEKEKALIKYWNRKLWSIIKSYLKLPQLLLTLTIFITSYLLYAKCSFKTSVGIGFCIWIISSFYQWFSIYKGRSKYLFINHFYRSLFNVSITAGILFNYFLFSGLLDTYLVGFSYSDPMDALIYATSVTVMLILLAAAFTGQFKKLLMNEIEVKYAHLNINPNSSSS